MSRTASARPGKAASASLERTLASYRQGFHATVYDVRRDPDLDNKDIIRDKTKVVFPFVSGQSYKGQWKDDVKQGFGTEVTPDGTKYEGEWLADKRHGRGTFFVKKGKRFIRQYVGDWAAGNMEGFGVYYYPSGEIYRGDWVANKRSGNGRLELPSGDYYVGEWRDDVQSGFGTYNVANGNLYEGLWMHGLKEGSGRFFYAATGKVYEGEWAEDQPRCGEYREPSSEEATRFCEPTVRKESFGLPELGLVDAREVVGIATATTRSENAARRGIANAYISPEALLDAKRVFVQLDVHGSNLVPFYSIPPVLLALGVSSIAMLSFDDLQQELELERDQPLSYVECIDIGQLLLDNMR